jgi:hypothetical protein
VAVRARKPSSCQVPQVQGPGPEVIEGHQLEAVGEGEVEDRQRQAVWRQGRRRLQVLLSTDEEGVTCDSIYQTSSQTDRAKACRQTGQPAAPEEVMYKTKTGKYKATAKAKPTTKAKATKQFKAYKANTSSKRKAGATRKSKK